MPQSLSIACVCTCRLTSFSVQYIKYIHFDVLYLIYSYPKPPVFDYYYVRHLNAAVSLCSDLIAGEVLLLKLVEHVKKQMYSK